METPKNQDSKPYFRIIPLEQQRFLNDFIANDKGTVIPLDLKATAEVHLALEKKMFVDEFAVHICSLNLQNKPCGTITCDFNATEEYFYAKIVKKHNGIYYFDIQEPEKKSDNNMMYAAFSNPVDAFNCMIKIFRINSPST